MRKWVGVVLCIWLSAVACATENKEPRNQNASERYFSSDARFSIALRGEPTVVEIPAIKGKSTAGKSLSWKSDGGQYIVLYSDWLIEPLDEARIIQISSDNLINGVRKVNGEVIASAKTDFGDYAGIESRFRVSDHIFLYRHIARGNRVYVLSARWPEQENGERQLRVLDSFRIEE